MADKYGCPMPGDKILDRIVVASVWYFDSADDPCSDGTRNDEFTVIMLNKKPPYFKVALITTESTEDGFKWVIIDEVNHMNIVPAVNGENSPEIKLGYIDMGGDY